MYGLSVFFSYLCSILLSHASIETPKISRQEFADLKTIILNRVGGKGHWK
jgi:hypothetical protein